MGVFAVESKCTSLKIVQLFVDKMDRIVRAGEMHTGLKMALSHPQGG